MKKTYMEPTAIMIILEEQSELLEGTVYEDATKGEDSWAKKGTSFDASDDEGETDGTDWFNDNKSGW